MPEPGEGERLLFTEPAKLEPFERDYADPTKGDLKRVCGLHLKS